MKNLYIRSPLFYMGDKHKLLPELIPHFPKNKEIQHLALVKQSRLSVMPIDYKSWKVIYKMGKVT